MSKTQEAAITLTQVCVMCKSEHKLEINAEDYFHGMEKRAHGALVQNAFPQLTANQRELFFISHVCGKCWDEMWAEPEPPEDCIVECELCPHLTSCPVAAKNL